MYETYEPKIPPARPVWCPVCEKRLYYFEDIRFEPEYYINITDPVTNDKKFFYIHQACLHRFIDADALKIIQHTASNKHDS